MTIEKIRIHAKENGWSEKKIAELIAELHPDENGKLSLEEAAQALATIRYVTASKEYVRTVLETTKAIRSKQAIKRKIGEK